MKDYTRLRESTRTVVSNTSYTNNAAMTRAKTQLTPIVERLTSSYNKS